MEYIAEITYYVAGKGMDGCGVPRLSESCGGISPVIGGTSTLERPENHPLPPHIQLPDSLAPCYRAGARALPDSHDLKLLSI